MLTTATLLVSQNPHLIGTVQRAHDDHNALGLEVCGRIEKAATRLHPGVVMVLVHLTRLADREPFHHLVREAVTRTPATIAVVCSDVDAARDARALVPEGIAVEVCLPTEVRKLIGSLGDRVRLVGPARIDGAPTAAGRCADPVGLSTQSNHGQRAQILRAAALDVTVLLTGETGTGKTVMARQIHDASPRKDRPFLVVDCGALSATLIESEIFGHVRGAFTGADKGRVGKIAAARDGTLVLDEINSLPLAQQAKLLRVIEDRVFDRLGENRPRRIAARMIVVSNVPLDQEVARERFRADLYHRLNVIEFRLTPLRERPAEVIPLAKMFHAEHPMAHAHGIGIAPDALRALETYAWPGNIRELRNVIERVVALGDGSSVQLADLPEAIRAHGDLGHSIPLPIGCPSRAADVAGNGREEEEVRRICDALRKHSNNRVRAAAELRISRVTLYKKLNKYGLMTNGWSVKLPRSPPLATHGLDSSPGEAPSCRTLPGPSFDGRFRAVPRGTQTRQERYEVSTRVTARAKQDHAKGAGHDTAPRPR